jgi:hypothetical protein
MMPFLDPVTVKPGEGPIAAKPTAKKEEKQPTSRRLAASSL